MNLGVAESLASLYQEDETAWLERMAELIAEQRLSELDYDNLREFLTDMARRDRREVLSRLTTLLSHWLKWEFQPGERSKSWRATIAEQRRELLELLESGTLRRYAEEALTKAYQHAIGQAAIETGMAESAFPAASALSLDEWLSKDPKAE